MIVGSTREMAVRAERICVAAYNAWKAGRPAKMRDMAIAAGYAPTSQGAVWRTLQLLVEAEYVKMVPLGDQHTLGLGRRGDHLYTRGPRLGGMDSKGRPLRVIDETRGWT